MSPSTPHEITSEMLVMVIEEARGLDKGREKSLVIIKLEEALHWLDATDNAPIDPVDTPKEEKADQPEAPEDKADVPAQEQKNDASDPLDTRSAKEKKADKPDTPADQSEGTPSHDAEKPVDDTPKTEA